MSSNKYNLTKRESTVLGCLPEEMSYKMIASKIGISHFTVNACVRKIYEKLQVNSNAESISLAFKSEIV